MPAVATYLLLEAFYLVRRKRGITDDVPEGARRRFTRAGRLLAGGWCAHYLPFFAIQRALFLHHYLPCVCFGAMLSPVVAEHLLVEVLRLPPRAHAAASVAVVAAMVHTYVALRPLSHGLPLGNEAMAALQWRAGWDIINDVQP